MITITEYIDAAGRNRYRESFRRLDERSQARIIVGVARMSQGNFGDTRSLAGGIQERRFLGRGAGPRLYYFRIGENLVLLLVAGDKSSEREQRHDIARAREYLHEWTTRSQ